MGLFSGKDVTTVGTTVSRIIEDARVPDSIANGVARNLVKDDDQMVEHVLDQLSNSIGLHAGRMHQFGRTKYLFGLPNSSLRTSSAGKDACIAAIQALERATIQVSYYHFAGFNYLHYGWKTLTEAYGYAPATNQLSVLSALHGKPVFLANMQIVLTNAAKGLADDGSLETWGTPPSAGVTTDDPVMAAIKSLLTPVRNPDPVIIDTAASQDYLKVTVAYAGKTESFNLLIPAHDPSADFHHVRYLVAGQVKYWTYQANTGEHPAVDTLFNTVYAEGGQFFPITYFRYNKEAGNKDKTSQAYKDSSKLCDLIGMDYDALTDAIHQNPNIDQVEQAMMMLAVPPNSNHPLDQRYLFDFFSGICDELPNGALKQSWPGMHDLMEVLATPVDASSIIIQDKRFKMALSFSSISRYRVGGNLGKVGSYHGQYTGKDNGDAHIYQYQDADASYIEVRVINLRMTYWIWEQYTVIADDAAPILLVPLNLSITKHYSVPDREALYARSLHYVFNSRVVTHVKWYQTGFFKGLLIVAAVIVSVVTMQPEIYSLAVSIVTIIGVSSTVALVLAATLLLIERFVVSALINTFVKKIGGKATVIVAVIAALYAGYRIYDAGGIKNVPWAKDILSASTNLASTGAKLIMAENYQDLVGAYSEFDQYVKEQTKTLDDAKALLDSGLHLNPLIVYGETPTQFYTRTVHSGNIGVLGIDMVESYVDLALTLPKLSDTVGDI